MIGPLRSSPLPMPTAARPRARRCVRGSAQSSVVTRIYSHIQANLFLHKRYKLAFTPLARLAVLPLRHTSGHADRDATVRPMMILAARLAVSLAHSQESIALAVETLRSSPCSFMCSTIISTATGLGG